MNNFQQYLQMFDYTFILWSILLFDCYPDEEQSVKTSFWECLNCGVWMYDEDDTI